jgi:uncharacterized YigZ family protein
MAYITVAGPGQAELIVRKSQFIAHVAPVRSEEDAWAFIERIRTKHKEATHNCFAFKVGALQRLSDDGEPSGTAGRPIYDVIDKKGLSDVAVVVTRYFGGILLGAGGLVRAYSGAAVAGVEAAGVAEAILATDLRISLDYSLVGKVQYLLQQRGALLLNQAFDYNVVTDCRLPATEVEGLEGDLADISAGRIKVEQLRELHVAANLRPIHGDGP